MTLSEDPKLAPPGAGIPFFQKLLLRYIAFPHYCRKMSWKDSQSFFEREAQKILSIARSVASEEFNRKVLVKSLPGLEDSSRFWSLSMVLEHLIIAGTRISEGLIELTHGKIPDKEADTATVKPFKNLPAIKIIPEYQKFAATFLQKTTSEIGDQKTTITFRHPWFGMLNAHQWMALGAIHQQIHRKQAEQIVKGLKN